MNNEILKLYLSNGGDIKDKKIIEIMFQKEPKIRVEISNIYAWYNPTEYIACLREVKEGYQQGLFVKGIMNMRCCNIKENLE